MITCHAGRRDPLTRQRNTVLNPIEPTELSSPNRPGLAISVLGPWTSTRHFSSSQLREVRILASFIAPEHVENEVLRWPRLWVQDDDGVWRIFETNRPRVRQPGTATPGQRTPRAPIRRVGTLIFYGARGVS